MVLPLPRPARIIFCFRVSALRGAVQKLIASNKLPHLLFYGPPGTGKTSTILACAKKLYGADFKMMVLEVGVRAVFVFGTFCHCGIIVVRIFRGVVVNENYPVVSGPCAVGGRSQNSSLVG